LPLIGDFQQAEDVVQEAFVAAWSSSAESRRPGGISRLAQDDCAAPCLPSLATKGVVDTAAGGGSRGAERGAGSRSSD
jgi:hypothetical protein